MSPFLCLEPLNQQQGFQLRPMIHVFATKLNNCLSRGSSWNWVLAYNTQFFIFYFLFFLSSTEGRGIAFCMHEQSDDPRIAVLNPTGSSDA